MAWFKENIGKTLGDAVRHCQARETNPLKTKIKPHNQFNQYARDFIEANPTLGMNDARKYWSLKKALPSETGRHTYDPSDLILPDET